MTVAELQKKLTGLDPKTHIVVNHEADLFEITDDVGICAGEPFRHENTRKAGFRAIHNGPAKWLFIDIDHA
jgi:hypothetical protein